MGQAGSQIFIGDVYIGAEDEHMAFRSLMEKDASEYNEELALMQEWFVIKESVKSHTWKTTD